MRIVETAVSKDNGKLLGNKRKIIEKLPVLAKTAIQSIFTYKYIIY